MTSSRLGWWLDFTLLFLLTSLLIFPLFQAEYLNNWSSIESTFIADARMINDGLSVNGWHPYWYCGTRFDYVYPPGLRFGTAWIANLLGVSTFRAYHLFAGIIYALGICFVYWLARVGSGERPVGWLTAAAVALVSPAYVLMKEFRDDAFGSHLPPMRLHVLMQYGEGPHMSSLALLGGFLAAAWVGLRAGRPLMFALAAALAAGVVSLNFYGATAMAMLFPVMVWALWVTHRDAGILLRAGLLAAISWGLCAFWLTPSYVRITLDNMRLVASPGNTWSAVLALITLVVFVAASLRVSFAKEHHAWPLFLSGSLAILALDVLGNKWFGFRVIGEPHRLVPELDLVILLALVYLLWWLWSHANELANVHRYLSTRAVYVAIGVVFGLMIAASLPYAGYAWKLYPQDHSPQERLQFKIADWVARNLPDTRVFVAGSIRFWYNAWHNLPQVAGGSEQGLLNAALVPGWWELRLGEDPQLSLLWLQATGAGAVVISSQESQEVYKDYTHPAKFEGLLPVLHDNQAGEKIYQVPRRFPERARVVEYAELASLRLEDARNPTPLLREYVRVIEEGPDSRVAVERVSPQHIRLHAELQSGQALLVQESYDPSWRATAAGAPLEVERDPVLGFLVVRAGQGAQDVDLVFGVPGENRLGRWLSLLTVLGLAIWLAATLRRRPTFRR